LRVNLAVITPSCITIILLDIPRISGSSEEIRIIAIPFFASSEIKLCTVAFLWLVHP
jgi:hypothetical protein